MKKLIIPPYPLGHGTNRDLFWILVHVKKHLEETNRKAHAYMVHKNFMLGGKNYTEMVAEIREFVDFTFQ